MWCAARGIPLYGPTGASAHLRGFARALLARGHRIRVAVPLSSDGRGAHDRDLVLPSVHLDTRAWPHKLRSIGARIDGHRLALRALFPRPDLLWERHSIGSRAAYRWSHLLGVQRWVEVNAPLSLERRWPDPPRLAELKWEVASLRSADRLFVVSRWLQRWLIEEARCDAARIAYLPNGVSDGRPGDRLRVREALALRGPVVGFLGAMSRWQGADLLPALLDALGAEWTGLALGDGPTSPAPHPRIVRTGVVAHHQIPDLVSAFDVAVAPYRRDAPPWFCPLKILEYRAQGIPIVASPVGDTAELIDTEGILSDAEDIHAFADAVRTALSLPRRPRVRRWEDVVDEVFSPAAL